nr:MAG TPA: hypothetical protein [Caudoviricetes sp.]
MMTNAQFEQRTKVHKIVCEMYEICVVRAILINW